MSDIATTIDAADVRHLLLQGTGLLDSPHRPATDDELHDIIDHLGYVQLDTISTVLRAHDHIMRTRVATYTEGALLRLVEQHRRLFEHWTHDASVIPLSCLPAWRGRMSSYQERIRNSAWWQKTLGPNAERYIAEVREAVFAAGEVMSRDFDTPDGRPAGTWWGWKPHKAALEYLWRTGELAISKRRRFQKVFAWFEDVYPDSDLVPVFDTKRAADWSCASAMDRLTVATAKEIAEFHGLIRAPAARAWCEDGVKSGWLERVSIRHANDDAETPAYALSDWRERLNLLPAAPPGVRLLSPFDPAIRTRDRTDRLFGFHYRFEAFVPAAKREYGYYVLPILDGDRLIGRVDAVLDRGTGRIRQKGLWWEPGVRDKRRLKAAVDDACTA
ncbi:MAG: YcaQ family DNA glycosylase, partial [Phycisphaerales bacterium]|nr:YcaQ family DNA glycosylase [Phycisphaerales bacterium]